MGVTLGEKKLASGNKSLYLDISIKGDRYKEYLNIIIKKATTPESRQHNKELKELAKNIRAKRELELQASEYDYTPAFKKNIDFVAYYSKFIKDYTNKDVRIVKYSLYHFKEFIKTKDFNDTINSKLITEDLCRQYRNYLETVVNGETICNYFTKFKKVINKAYEDNILKQNFAKNIKNTKSGGLKKQILDFSEIQKLAQAHCGNDNVKRAFLFSLNTGLRFVDIKALTWNNIHNNNLILTQSKTKNSSNSSQVRMDLNQTAIKVIGKRGKNDEPVFILPSHTACLKDLRVWVSNAGIDKHITWHCARHTFAVNLLDSDIVGADIKTVSELLGHSSLKHTEKYLHVVDKRKKEAINKLPDIEL